MPNELEIGNRYSQLEQREHLKRLYLNSLRKPPLLGFLYNKRTVNPFPKISNAISSYPELNPSIIYLITTDKTAILK